MLDRLIKRLKKQRACTRGLSRFRPNQRWPISWAKWSSSSKQSMPPNNWWPERVCIVLTVVVRLPVIYELKLSDDVQVYHILNLKKRKKICKEKEEKGRQICTPRVPGPGPTRKPYNQVARWSGQVASQGRQALCDPVTRPQCLAGDEMTRLVAWLHRFVVTPMHRSTRGQLPIGWYSCYVAFWLDPVSGGLPLCVRLQWHPNQTRPNAWLCEKPRLMWTPSYRWDSDQASIYQQDTISVIKYLMLLIFLLKFWSI